MREAKPLVIQADVMQEEMEGALKYEYTAKSIPLLLHQVGLLPREASCGGGGGVWGGRGAEEIEGAMKY